MFGHRVQHRLKRRIRDDVQHLGGGSLLLRSLDQALPRVGDLPFACFKLSFVIGAGLANSTKPRLRFGQVKLATSRSTLRPFARQGHLHRPRSPIAEGDGAWRRIARSSERASAYWPLWVQTRASSLGGRTSASAECRLGPGGQSVGQAAQFCLESVRKDHVGLHSFLSMSLIDARRRNARPRRLRFSQSLARRLHRPSHANVRSTTHRLGKTMKPFA